MEIREGLLQAKSHEWVKEEGDVVTIGLTDYAQSEPVSYTHLSEDVMRTEIRVGKSVSHASRKAAIVYTCLLYTSVPLYSILHRTETR